MTATKKGVLPGFVMAGILCAQQGLAEQNYAPVDALYDQVAANVAAMGAFQVITEIDHSRLAAEAGEDMPPAHVLIFSDPALDAALTAIDPRLAVDLPLRVLAFEDPESSKAMVLYNNANYIEHRYGVTLPQDVKNSYQAAIDAALLGIPPQDVKVLPSEGLEGDGLVQFDSPHDFDETLRRLREAIDAQDDTVWFGEVDFDDRAKSVGIDIAPAQLLLFGGPGPGGKAMSGAPSLGLDAFCQKLLVLQDADGNVQVLMNDLLALAERHDVSKSIALRVINRRLFKTFSDALEG